MRLTFEKQELSHVIKPQNERQINVAMITLCIAASNNIEDQNICRVSQEYKYSSNSNLNF